MTMSSRTAVLRRAHLTPLMYSLPVKRLKEILIQILPSLTLGPVEEIPSTQLARLYSLTMSDDRKLLLSLAPSLAVRLLRHEATMLSSEAALIGFITGRDPLDTRPSTPEEPQACSKERADLIALVPKLIRHSTNNREMAYPYSIFDGTAGEPLSSVSIYLNIPEHKAIDRQVGSMVRAMASMTSLSGTFGTANLVLPEQLTSGVNTKSLSRGAETWSEGFSLLLEGALRDGEDVAILMPYETIRAQYQRLSHHLDSVLHPRLLVLDAGSSSNILIQRALKTSTSTSASDSPSPHTVSPIKPATRLAGLRSWSQGVFGDPLLSSCFEDPSEAFLEGWRDGGEDVIEDQENAEVRLMLYRLFRGVVGVVMEYVRPQGDSSRKELEARRRLTSALAELERVETLKRVRSGSMKDEEAKRRKTERVDKGSVREKDK
ncbi:hypothetical protein BJ878DRAFT_543264 [Calycina marina]|uniref:Uncharacterized protein n=1 Tax=Calycina marina TaxID=1763456 RepID=A0A9P8CE86_9HELO|nr:hypothetical protein BJ878DRAFT_543264 [Calycina marina]